MADLATTPRHGAFVERLRERVLPLRGRAEVRNGWLRRRLDTILPELMAREGFDLWIVAAREYNEDPVIMTLLPEPAMAARRRTILVFARRPDGEIERLTLDRYGFGDFYQRAWDPDAEEQDACLARVVRERDPGTIGLNVSATFAFGDGLTHHEYTALAAALGEEYLGRVRGAERLCVGWLERRIPAELEAYPRIVALGHEIIAEAFSPRTIRPGSTTTEDVVWWMRQTMLDAGLRAWFQPTVAIQARGDDPQVEALARDQFGQDRLEPPAQPAVAHLGPPAQRQDALAQRLHEGAVARRRQVGHRSSSAPGCRRSPP